jgi:hypothetical protein
LVEILSFGLLWSFTTSASGVLDNAVQRRRRRPCLGFVAACSLADFRLLVVAVCSQLVVGHLFFCFSIGVSANNGSDRIAVYL